MNCTDINDIRDIKEFKGITFSKFKKADVLKELLNNLINSKIEPACYWSAELICSGNYIELWDIIIYFYSKYIHLGNLKLSIYLNMRVNQFKEILNLGYKQTEIRMRNNNKIRELFAEVICVLCQAKRKHCFQEQKIMKTDFDMTQMMERFTAPSITYADRVFRKEDPKEIYVAMNELGYSLMDGSNIILSCYWIEWIIEFESKIDKKAKLTGERRSNIAVESKYQTDIIWMIWELFLDISKTKTKIIQKIVDSLLALFTLKYTNSCKRKRKYILYCVVSILCEKNIALEDMISEQAKTVIANVIKNIDNVYKQIKKNEENPKTDYLFKDIKQRNLEKTIEKLEAINNLGDTFIPRV